MITLSIIVLYFNLNESHFTKLQENENLTKSEKIVFLLGTSYVQKINTDLIESLAKENGTSLSIIYPGPLKIRTNYEHIEEIIANGQIWW